MHSLSVCISLLDPKRSMASSSLFHSFRSQHMYETSVPVNPETLCAMLPKLGECVPVYFEGFVLMSLWGWKKGGGLLLGD